MAIHGNHLIPMDLASGSTGPLVQGLEVEAQPLHHRLHQRRPPTPTQVEETTGLTFSAVLPIPTFKVGIPSSPGNAVAVEAGV